MKLRNFFRTAMLFIIFICVGGFVGIRVSDSIKTEQQLSAAKQMISVGTSIAKEVEKNATETSVVPTSETPAPEEEDKEQDLYFGNLYSEGEDVGVFSFDGIEMAMAVGTTSEVLDSHKAMLHSGSTNDHKVVLGHSYKNGDIFGNLRAAIEDGLDATIQYMDGSVESFKMAEYSWVSEEEYNTQEYTEKIFNDKSDLMLITCASEDGEAGRLIVKCQKNA